LKKTLSISLAFSEDLIEKGLMALIDESKFLTLFSVLRTQEEVSDLFKKKESPDVLLIDVFSPVFTLDKILAYSSFSAKTKVVPLTSRQNKHDFDRVLKSGINNFLLKSSSQKEIEECLQTIMNGDHFISSKVLDVIKSDNAVSSNEVSYKATCASLNISEREIEIIKLIAEGCINKEIADRLFLSNHTINTHRKNIMQKLGINNTSGIVLFAVKEGIVSANDFLFSSK
jgi:DNA-binding NarL/FixJ family response regulator